MGCLLRGRPRGESEVGPPLSHGRNSPLSHAGRTPLSHARKTPLSHARKTTRTTPEPSFVPPRETKRKSATCTAASKVTEFGAGSTKRIYSQDNAGNWKSPERSRIQSTCSPAYRNHQ